ncbi:MAG TPA: DUF2254 domain-containing protein [Devosia sp.]|uniref:DUF2254 domain-containing protein n=1 Tax=Devosia sp. TaxID=1871048 RepID=UPI002DDC957E|nr:DUF2254 domain-containing protein [Devosia sp.]HEV2517899.1 DUF2254 domain-containing protein [Devosia sp.]
MTQLSFYLRQLLNKMWFLPAAFSAFAMLTIGLAFYVARWAPDELPLTISQQAIQSVLEILATSLLTVSVFALSTLVSALSSASAATSPRAVALIIGDRGAQTSISVFIGAFLFSILAILGLSAGIYSSAGRMLLFSVTLAVVAVVIAALIRWIAQISNIGRVGHTISRVEEATAAALQLLEKHPLFDGHPLEGAPVGQPVRADKLGHVQHFDAARLQKLAEKHELRIAVTARPGTYVSPLRPLMHVEGHLEDELAAELVDAFVIGDQRSFESDPRFGFIVLAEIADRALSPAVNDPGTAISVIGTVTRLLVHWQPGKTEGDVVYDRLSILALAPQDLLEDAFRPIGRDGAATIEVVVRLLVSLEVISTVNQHLRPAALAVARDAAGRARKALSAPADLETLEGAAKFAELAAGVTDISGVEARP